MAQWLGLRTPNAGGTVLIPGWETKTPHTVGCGQKMQKKKKKVNESFIRQSKTKVNIPY